VNGHFKKRGVSWYFWLELEPGPDGARKQKSQGGFKTRKEAVESAYQRTLFRFVALPIHI